MTEARSRIDLDALARPAGDASFVPHPKGRWRWWLVPLVILIGFGAVFFDTLREALTEAVPVTVVRPRAASGQAASQGAIVFQAAGWVEPDPSRIRVTSLAPGVIRDLLVQESDAVKKDDVIARLVDDDARIALRAANAVLARRRAELDFARVELGSSEESFEAALEVTETRDVARADFEARSNEVDRRRAAAHAAEAAVHVAESDLETQRYLKQADAVGPWQLELSRARLHEARANLAALRAAVPEAQAEALHAKANLTKAELDLNLRIEERRRIGAAKANVALATAAMADADAALADAKLRLDRMTVRSPMDGIVLFRDSHEGTPVGPRPDDIPVVHLYDPQELRVRVDVPQAQVAGASVGQRAEIRCDVRRDRPYAGRVLRLVETADIQKVTLEVQVRVVDPDALLKPDMLCQVTVYREPAAVTSDGSSPAVMIPSRCVRGDQVWVLDGETGLAARRSVTLGARSGNDVVVTSGLNVTDKVIDRGTGSLEVGARVRVEADR